MADVTEAAGDKMNRIYRRQRQIYDLTRRGFLVGRRRVIDRLECPPGGAILEVGCGTAWNLIEAAKRNPRGRLYGLDISTEMLDTARRSVERAGLADRHRAGPG